MNNLAILITNLDHVNLENSTTAEFVFSNHVIGSYTRYDDETTSEFYDNICEAVFDLARCDHIQWSAISVVLS